MGRPKSSPPAWIGLFIIDIIDAQLKLAKDNVFRANNPVEGISVTATNLNATSIQVRVTGEAGAPGSRCFSDEEGLILSLTPASQTESAASCPNFYTRDAGN